MATDLAIWLGSAKSLYGSVTVASIGQILSCVYGTVASAFSPLPYIIIISLIKPQNFDRADFRKEKLAFGPAEGEDNITGIAPASATDDVIKNELNVAPAGPGSQPHLKRWFRIAAYWSIATFLGHRVLWPLPMYVSKYQFSKTCFNAWLVVAIVWRWVPLLVAGSFPLVGGRRQFRVIWQALRHGNNGGASGTAGSPGMKQSSSDDVVDKTNIIESKI